jgi:hypothetical protein
MSSGLVRRPAASPAIVAAVDSLTRAALEAMIGDAIVDCYNDSECVTGFYTMLDEHLAMPFRTSVLGGGVTVTGIELTDDGQIMAVCVRGGSRQRIPLLELPLPTPPPAGAEWIQAFRQWAR